MPGPPVETTPAGRSSLVRHDTRRYPEVLHGDVRAARPQFAVPHLDHGREGDERRHDPHGYEQAHDEGHRGVDGGEDQGRHGAADRRGDEGPQGRAQAFAVLDSGADAAPPLLHYPRGVTETVDVLIVASEPPVFAHPGDAGADLVAAEAVRLEPGRRALVSTGVRIALPDGYAAFVVPRSGLAAKHGITIVNSPGTVDAGYRGEIKVALLNTDLDEAYEIAVGDRIAQLIVMPVPPVRFIPVDDLPASVRGEGGFGSSGYQTPSGSTR